MPFPPDPNAFTPRSQARQDQFVWDFLDHPRTGSFLDIGCSHPVEINNTYALERQGWRGLLVDIADVRVLCDQLRSSPYVQGDASKLDYMQLLTEHNIKLPIDYLSLDVDENTLPTLKQLPLDSLRFRVITIEHDSYRFGPAPRDEMRSILSAHGYTLICEDVSSPGPFEDWWADLSTVDRDLALAMRCSGKRPEEITIPTLHSPFFESQFDRIFCINLDRRPDRWQHVQSECARFHLTRIERFPGHDKVLENGVVNGNCGCTASHRALLEIIAWHKWDKVLVLEDDFSILHRDFHRRFTEAYPEVPADWDMLYLGGHYANAPQFRAAPRVIKINGMKTTSSYAIRGSFARQIAPYISGRGPIDELYSGFTPYHNCYILSPRLMAQYSSYSDLTNASSTNEMCMTDTRHENMV